MAANTAALMKQAQALISAGICFIPADRKTKSPCRGRERDPETGETNLLRLKWEKYQSERPTLADALSWFNCLECAETGPDALAVVAGAVSGGLECLDFDCEAVAYEEWSDAVERQVPGLLARLTVVSTQSGGRHVLYRCPGAVEGNQVLARHVERTGNGEAVWRGKTMKESRKHPGHALFTVIETRGEGGYFLTTPSDGYNLVQGTLAAAPLISPEERAVLFSCAREADEEHRLQKMHKEAAQAVPQQATPVARVQQTSAEAPGISPLDAYNRQPDVAAVVLAMLKGAGWKECGQNAANYFLTRPNKDSADGHSATLRKSDGLLYNFSANADGFGEREHATPAGVFAALNHGGDMSKAASALRLAGFGDGGGTGSNRPQAHAEPEQHVAQPAPQPWQPGPDAAVAMESVRLVLQARQGEKHVGIEVPCMPEMSKRLDGLSGYTLLSGDSGTGKTVLSCGVALSVAGLHLPDPNRQHASEEQAAAGSGVKVVYVAAELGRTEILLRMLGVLSGRHNFGLRKGIPSEEPKGSLRLRQMAHHVDAVEHAWRALHRLQAAGHLTVLDPEEYVGTWQRGGHCLQRLAEACERVRGGHERMLVIVDSLDALEVHQSGHQPVDYRDGLGEDSAKVQGLQRWRKSLGNSGAILLLQEESKAAAGSGSLHAGRGSSKLPYRADAVLQVMSARARDGTRPVGTLALGLRPPPDSDGSNRRVSPLDLVVNKARGGARGLVCLDFVPAQERVREIGQSLDAHEMDEARASWGAKKKAEAEAAKSTKRPKADGTKSRKAEAVSK